MCSSGGGNWEINHNQIADKVVFTNGKVTSLPVVTQNATLSPLLAGKPGKKQLGCVDVSLTKQTKPETIQRTVFLDINDLPHHHV